MRLNRRNQLIDILNTVGEMIEYIRTLKDSFQEKEYVDQCIGAVESIDEIIRNEAGVELASLQQLISACEQITDEGADRKKSTKKVLRALEEAKTNIRRNVNVRYSAVFLPYKASMWTALESIWQAAKEDPNCDAYVVPIPYYELNSVGGEITMRYEGDMYPDYVPITSYEEYDISADLPEMVFIHNPYDDTNTVTQVPREYFSYNLKNYTDCLVYSPYFTYGGHNTERDGHMFNLNGIKYSDKVVVQSTKLYKSFVEVFKYPKEKFVMEGSPKIDAIVNIKKEEYALPDDWKVAIGDRKKIFLINTHMMYFIDTANQIEYYKFDCGVEYHKLLMKKMQEHEDCGYIWRPHPLLKDVMNKNILKYGDKYRAGLEIIEKMEKLMDNLSNCIIDRTGDFRTSFVHSDALISTWSTLVNEYAVTGKPILMLSDKPAEEVAKAGCIDFSNCYYTDNLGVGEKNLEEYIEMVKKNADVKKEDRMADIRAAFLNLDGTAGEKTYQQIKAGIERS